MKFLIPVGGVVDFRFGILTTPARADGGFIPMGIRSGMPWAADNDCFRHAFAADRYFAWLASMKPWRSTCLFVSAPDVVGDAIATRDLFEEWSCSHEFDGWPLAFVAQDGQEDQPLPDPQLWAALFVGGSTKWKLSAGAADCIMAALILGKRIHIGRVNWGIRYRHFAAMPGSEDFTCDGTRTRFDGVDKALSDWASLMQKGSSK